MRKAARVFVYRSEEDESIRSLQIVESTFLLGIGAYDANGKAIWATTLPKAWVIGGLVLLLLGSILLFNGS